MRHQIEQLSLIHINLLKTFLEINAFEFGGEMMILQEEQYIIHWLTQYGVLTRTQIIRMLEDKQPQTAEKIIRNLIKQFMIADIADGYYLGLDAMCQPDQKIISAVWVLLSFLGQVDPMAHYPASYPSQLFFLKFETKKKM